MREIKLTRGKVALVDDEDYEYLNGFKWHVTSSRNYAYAGCYIKSGGRERTLILMHRFILCPPTSMIIDHINHNTLDNRKENLRICSKSQNGMNRMKQKNGRSPYKGVSWHSMGGKWTAQIAIDKKVVYIGLYNSEKEAALAYNNKATELYGEFAQLNQVQND